jgi:hypothetical protein
MRRRVFKVAAVASLVLFAALCVLWARSYARGYALSVTKVVWPSADSCVVRSLTVRLVLGHWVASWGRTDYDPVEPEGIRFHHAMDVATFRKKYAAGVKWSRFAYDVWLGPQRSIHLANGTKVVLDPDSYLFGVPRWHGFGSKDDPPTTYLGQTTVQHHVVAPAWPAAVALAVLPVLWVVKITRRRRRAHLGRCRNCGYDLRATPERCPECGASANAAPQPGG